MQKHFPRKGTADSVGSAQGHVGKQEFSGKVYAATNVAATNFIRVLPRLV
jgi:hypothetical protein